MPVKAMRPVWLAPAVLAVAGLCAVVPLFAAVASSHPTSSRWVFAACLVALILASAARWPVATAVSTLLLLAFLAGFRRLLIEVAPWTSYDPLVVLGPITAGALLLRPLAAGVSLQRVPRLAVAITLLAGLAILEVGNPGGGGIKAGVTGLVFILGPLLWFYVGMTFGGSRALDALFKGAVAVAVVVALYGLAQTFAGFPVWDQDWLSWLRVSQGSLGAFQVNNSVRAFASFSSFAEYATYLSAAVVVTVAWMLRRGRGAGVVLVILLPALFLASARGPVLLAAFASLCLVMVTVSSLRRRAAVALVAAVVVIGGSAVLSSNAGSSNGLISHEASGLSNPFSSQSSTLGVHTAIIVAGLRAGLANPIGSGTAATNLAGQKLGGAADFTSARAAYAQSSGLNGSQNGTEFDISDAFVSMGLLGGLLYIGIVIGCFALCWRAARTRRDFASYASLGLLIVMIGQWANGGYYALAPMLWFVVGSNLRLAQRAGSPGRMDPRRHPAGQGPGGDVDHDQRVGGDDRAVADLDRADHRPLGHHLDVIAERGEGAARRGEVGAQQGAAEQA